DPLALAGVPTYEEHVVSALHPGHGIDASTRRIGAETSRPPSIHAGLPHQLAVAIEEPHLRRVGDDADPLTDGERRHARKPRDQRRALVALEPQVCEPLLGAGPQ